jgi:hypothetical protein
MLRWGATDAELAEVYPGDELVPTPRHIWMRAVEIAAPPSQVWPWLVQMGQGRGGLYSYDWLENLAGCDIHSVDTLMPELQHLAVGDPIRLVREGYPADLVLRVAGLVPEQALVLETPNADQPLDAGDLPHMSWAFVLRPTSTGTRLIARTRADFRRTFAAYLSNQLMLEPVQFLMERKMLLGIKARAERLAAGQEAAPAA